jgi:glycosyltransferase involved in cell wall biosynthesis
MAPLIKSAGISVEVHLFWWDDLEQGRLYRFLTEQRFTVHCHRFSDSVTNVRSLLGRIGERPPRVVIADNVVPALLSTRYLRENGIRTVAIIRSDDPFYHGLIDTFASGTASHCVDNVVCVSQYLCEVVRTRNNNVRAVTIPSGTPLARELARSKPTAQWNMLYSGRLVEVQKRITDVTETLIQLSRDHKDLNCFIVGDGPSRSHVQRLVTASQQPIVIKGFVPPDRMLAELMTMHMILLLSDFEGTPTAIMEAMAAGVVPICRRIRSGIPELIVDGVTGYVVEGADEVSRHVSQLMSNPDVWLQMSINARSHIQQNFSMDVCAKKWIELLSEELKLADPQRFSVGNIQLPPTHHGYAHQDLRVLPATKNHGNTVCSLARKVSHYIFRILSTRRME